MNARWLAENSRRKGRGKRTTKTMKKKMKMKKKKTEAEEREKAPRRVEGAGSSWRRNYRFVG